MFNNVSELNHLAKTVLNIYQHEWPSGCEPSVLSLPEWRVVGCIQVGVPVLLYSTTPRPPTAGSYDSPHEVLLAVVKQQDSRETVGNTLGEGVKNKIRL